MDIPFPRPDVKNVFFLGYTVSGERFEIEGRVWEADLVDFELTKRMMVLGEKLVGDGWLRRIRRGGRREVWTGFWMGCKC
jgi:hypothetical protein